MRSALRPKSADNEQSSRCAVMWPPIHNDQALCASSLRRAANVLKIRLVIIVLLVLTVLALAALWLRSADRARIASAQLVRVSSESASPKTGAPSKHIEPSHPINLRSLSEQRHEMLRHRFFSPPRSEAIVGIARIRSYTR
jgi:hypothetical protein